METKFYAATPDLAFKNGKAYACQPMYFGTSLSDCVSVIKKLHSSFGYDIYQVSKKETKGLRLAYGMCRGGIRSGYEILSAPIQAYNTPYWEQKA